MIKFIKNLLGLNKPTETVKEILTPPAPVVTNSKPADNVPVAKTEYIPPTKPVNKVKAIGESGAQAVAAATAPKPANKKRRPYRGNKNAGGTVAKVNQPKPAVTEGKAQANVKTPNPNSVKPSAPPKPKAKRK